MPRKCCCPEGGDDCGGFCDPDYPSPDVWTMDIPDTLFTTQGEGHELGDCDESECDLRTGIFTFTRDPDFNGWGFGDPTACAWRTEPTLWCWQWTLPDPDFMTPGAADTRTMYWTVLFPSAGGGPARLRLFIVGVGYYQWKNDQLTPGIINCGEPFTFYRDVAGDLEVGLDSCVVNDAIELVLEVAA